ncbi:hypothetical protein DID88_009960 [Monilinia fructigena]|uniref:Prenylcysteine lyase domain-containing protein n=1 Tax=Monilinia fructigena TaxID=38457 RepID=A0A395IJT6_9HELO|nr:hypothetical protein DID88_009960 [Monilinia fructigena]
MYRGWNLILTIIVTFLSGESLAFWSWPFSFQAATVEQQPIIESTTYEYADSHAKRIAIIGAGAGGSSSAYHLQKFAAESDLSINVTIFERSSYIGGRSTTVNAYSNPLEPVELGASIFVEVNAILKNASREFGLRPKSTDTEEAEVLGIWDGAEFVYTQKDSDWKYWDIAKLLWKYGLAPLKTQRLVKTVVGKFLQLYEAPYFPFRSLSERIEELDLKTVASVTGEQFLADNNIEGSFATDLIQASTRIQGGNWQIFDSMIQSSNSTVRLNHTITEISKVQDQEKYNVKTVTTDAIGVNHTSEEPFDSIIIAAPLQYSNIKIASGLLQHTPDEIPYVTLHVTLFTSPYGLNPAYFNLRPNDEVPTTILTTLPKNIPAPTDPKDFVGPPEIQLAPGIYYTSGIESFISTMETSALMGKNVARLVIDDFVGSAKPDSEPLVENVVEVENVVIEPEIGVGGDVPVVDEL